MNGRIKLSFRTHSIIFVHMHQAIILIKLKKDKLKQIPKYSLIEHMSYN